ncbi:MAG: DUF6125 family protein [Candidatus Krumholzibacteriia bacterium]
MDRNDPAVYPFAAMSREELLNWLQDAAKLWLAHDGLWFQSVESRDGQTVAIVHDATAWGRFSPIEARRIMKRLGLEPGGGIDALVTCLRYRLYSHLNVQEIERPAPDRCILRMRECRVQLARQRKGLPDFPCKSVGLVEYETFARTIDPRLRVSCITCPPDPHPGDLFCAWEFVLGE